MAIGAPYVMIHPFWFMPTLPLWAFLIAFSFAPALAGSELKFQHLQFPGIEWKKVGAFLVLLAGAWYPYGIYKTVVWLDLLASLLIISSVLLSLGYIVRKSSPLTSLVLALALTGNFVQLVNYRTEEPDDRNFCLAGLSRYVETGEALDLGPKPSLARRYYCLGIPLK
jgi:hypothetical protein